MQIFDDDGNEYPEDDFPDFDYREAEGRGINICSTCGDDAESPDETGLWVCPNCGDEWRAWEAR